MTPPTLTDTPEWRYFCKVLRDNKIKPADLADFRTSEGLSRPSDMTLEQIKALPRFFVEGTRHRARFDAWLADPYQQMIRNVANALYEMAKEAA